MNRAQKLRDEAQIIVPRKGDPTPAANPAAARPAPQSAAPTSGTAGSQVGAPGATGRINVNTAPVSELERLPGVGPRLAQGIVDHRAANGPFATPADLAKVRGISDKMVEGWADLITFGP